MRNRHNTGFKVWAHYRVYNVISKAERFLWHKKNGLSKLEGAS